MYPQNYYFTKDHEWVAVDGDTATIGISDFAQKQLGDVVFVELPEIGKHLEVHQTVGSIESVKAVSEVFSPVSGQVIEANTALNNAPETINQDPYAAWMFRLKPGNPAELTALMNAAAYAAQVESEAH